MTADKIRLVFYLPELKSYIDRVHLISKIAESVEKAILVTSVNNLEPGAHFKSGALKIFETTKGAGLPGKTYFRASKLVKKLIRKYDINIVHDTFGHLLPLFLTQKKKFPNCRFITSLFNLSEWDLVNYVWPRYRFRCLMNRNLLLWLARVPLQRIICYKADHIVLQAPGLIHRLRDRLKLNSRKISWIPNNIHFSKTEFYPHEISSSGPIRLLYVGGFCRAKGGNRLLKLMKIAKEKGIDVKATVIGGMVDLDREFLSGEIEKNKLDKQISVVGRVSHEQVEQYMESNDWLFHMTDVDGSPRVVLEGLSRGLPVIGSTHPGVTILDPEKKFIEFSGTDGLIKLSDLLNKYKNDDLAYKKKSLSGYAHVKRYHSSESISKRYLSLYCSQLSNRN